MTRKSFASVKIKSITPLTQWKSSLSHTHTMADTKVETIARLAQWKIESFGPTNPYKRSDPFKIGIWNWWATASTYICLFRIDRIIHDGDHEVWIGCFRYLSVEKNRSVYIRLFPEPSRISKEQPPLARFVIRVSTSASNRRPYVSPSAYIFLFVDLFSDQFYIFFAVSVE